MTGTPKVSIAVVVTDSYGPGDEDLDTPVLLEILRDRGVDAEAVVWHRDDVPWESFDLALVRTPWDWVGRLEEFSGWLTRVGTLTQVLNPPSLIRWNLDKRYLSELAERGVPVVPTTYHRDPGLLHHALEAHLRHAACDLDAHVVVKPALGAGSVRTGLFRADDPAALALARTVLGAGGTVMLQPEIPELSAGEEKAVYVLDGEVTHAVEKGALLARGGGFLGGTYQENPRLVEADEDERALAQRVVRVAMECGGQDDVPLYARIDLVHSGELGLVVLEAELFEPALNLHLVPEVAGRFADAVLVRLGQ